jgi:hypothetical protein
MPSLETFIDALMHEKYKLIKMGVIKNSKAHVIVVHDAGKSQNQRSKKKFKGNVHANPKKEGYSKTLNDSLGFKIGRGKKGQKCTHYNHGLHLESSCMKKKIDIMVNILQKKTLGITFLRVTRRSQKINPL